MDAYYFQCYRNIGKSYLNFNMDKKLKANLNEDSSCQSLLIMHRFVWRRS